MKRPISDYPLLFNVNSYEELKIYCDMYSLNCPYLSSDVIKNMNEEDLMADVVWDVITSNNLDMTR